MKKLEACLASMLRDFAALRSNTESDTEMANVRLFDKLCMAGVILFGLTVIILQLRSIL